MNFKLNIYKDETYRDIERVAEADKLKIPYRVSIYIMKSLENVDIKNENDLLHFLSVNIDLLDKIVKATFGITDDELERIETTDLLEVGKELYQWGIEKVNGLKGNNSKNLEATVSN